MTQKQKRILIAKAIKFAVFFIGAVGILLALSSFTVMENHNIPFIWGAVEYLSGLALFLFSGYAYYKIYLEDAK